MVAEVKQWAKEHRDGNKWNIWSAILVVGLISGFISGVISGLFGSSNPNEPNTIESILTLASEIALMPMSVGLVLYVVNVVKEKKFEIGQLFSRYSDFIRIFVANLISELLIFVFTLLLIVPGIIRAISYFLINYILADPDFADLSAGEIPDLSRKIMDGHKGEYFTLNLYYFAMMLLGVFTLGILWIWIIPEMNLANAKFATNLLENYKKENKIEAKEETKEEVKEA